MDKSRSDLSGRAEKGVPAPLGRSHWRILSGPYGGPGPDRRRSLLRRGRRYANLPANVAAALCTGYQGNELVGMRLTEIVSVTDGFDPAEHDDDHAELDSQRGGVSNTAKTGSASRSVSVGGASQPMANRCWWRPCANGCAGNDRAAGDRRRSLRCFDRTAQPRPPGVALERRSAMRTEPVPAARSFVDVDRFKEINDTHGHLVGDRVLCEITQRLLNCVRHDDLVVRYGGDEFVVLLDTVRSRQQVEHLVARIAAEIRALIALADGQLIATASIGVAMAHDAADAVELLEVADQAMYRAKRAGRSVAR